MSETPGPPETGILVTAIRREVAPVTLMAVGAMMLFFAIILAPSLQSTLIVTLGMLLILAGGSLLGYSYLVGTRASTVNRQVASPAPEGLVEEIQRQLLSLREAIVSGFEESSLRQASEIALRASGSEFTSEQRGEIIAELKKIISHEGNASTALISPGPTATDAATAARLREDFAQTNRRLTSEIEALGRRGNLNLILGGVTTVCAVALLAYIVLTANVAPGDTPQFLWHYVPRITVSIFIEVFSFFFLRLYRSSLQEIKYFQNELTNMEAKYLALDVALTRSDPPTISSLLAALAGTDRNAKLLAGETTVELERLKHEKEGLEKLLDSTKDVVKAMVDSKKT